MNKLTIEQREWIWKTFITATEEARDVQWDWFENVLNAITEEDKCDTCVHGGYINEKVRLSEQLEVSDKQCWSCQLGTGECYCEQEAHESAKRI